MSYKEEAREVFVDNFNKVKGYSKKTMEYFFLFFWMNCY